MNITPNADKVLLEIIPEENKIGELLLPAKYANKIVRPKGRVSKKGIGKISPNGTYIPCFSREGDVVEYNHTAKAVEYTFNGKSYLMLPEADITCWLNLSDEEVEKRIAYYRGTKAIDLTPTLIKEFDSIEFSTPTESAYQGKTPPNSAMLNY